MITMHTWTRNRPSSRHRVDASASVMFHLPENPVCWLKGHTPRVRLIEPRTIEPWVLIDCRVCGRRGRYSTDGEMSKMTRDEAKALVARRVEVVRRDPRMVAASIDRRSGWDNPGDSVKAQVVVPKRLRPEVAARFHLGSRHSETPVDVHLTVGGAGVYASTSMFGRIAHAVTRGTGRDLSLRLEHGTAWWRLWTAEDHCQGPDHRHRYGGKYQPWRCRDGNVSINPLDYIDGGPLRYSYTDAEHRAQQPFVTAEGTEHLVDWTLRRQRLSRPRGPAKFAWSASWECRAGIPYRIDDWKGDSVLGSSESIPDSAYPDRWLEAAEASLRARITKNRERERWGPYKALREAI